MYSDSPIAMRTTSFEDNVMIAEPKPPPSIKRPIIALLTDYGSADYRVGAMKGVICDVNPEAKIVDITHDVPEFDLLSGAFTLRASYYDFPLNTIFVVALDPGGGAKRRPIIVKTENFYFLGPDNGVFSFIFDCERMVYVRHIDATHYFQQPVNNNFYGRDIYASSAAYLSKSYSGEDFGEQVKDYARINVPKPKVEGKQMKGFVMLSDRFGNVITNIEYAELMQLMQAQSIKSFQMTIGGKPIGPPARSIGEGQGELFMIAGASGYLEVAAPKKSAAEILDAKRGVECVLQFA